MIGSSRFWKCKENTGFIDQNDMLEFFHVDGTTIRDEQTKEEILNFLQQADVKGDGKVTFDDFRNLIMKSDFFKPLMKLTPKNINL